MRTDVNRDAKLYFIGSKARSFQKSTSKKAFISRNFYFQSTRQSSRSWRVEHRTNQAAVKPSSREPAKSYTSAVNFGDAFAKRTYAERRFSLTLGALWTTACVMLLLDILRALFIGLNCSASVSRALLYR